MPELSKTPGRPRDATITTRVMAAVRELLEHEGYDNLSIEAIARRAGVSRQALYKRWDGLPDLLLDVVLAGRAVMTAAGDGRDLQVPDTGTLASDLAELCRQGFEILSTLDQLGVLRGIIADAVSEPAMADRVRDELLGPDEERYRVIFERAAARGELLVDPVLASEIVPPALAGFAIHRGLVTNREPTPEQVETLIAVLVAGLAAT